MNNRAPVFPSVDRSLMALLDPAGLTALDAQHAALSSSASRLHTPDGRRALRLHGNKAKLLVYDEAYASDQAPQVINLASNPVVSMGNSKKIVVDDLPQATFWKSLAILDSADSVKRATKDLALVNVLYAYLGAHEQASHENFDKCKTLWRQCSSLRARLTHRQSIASIDPESANHIARDLANRNSDAPATKSAADLQYLARRYGSWATETVQTKKVLNDLWATGRHWATNNQAVYLKEHDMQLSARIHCEFRMRQHMRKLAADEKHTGVLAVPSSQMQINVVSEGYARFAALFVDGVEHVEARVYFILASGLIVDPTLDYNLKRANGNPRYQPCHLYENKQLQCPEGPYKGAVAWNAPLLESLRRARVVQQ